MKHLIITICQLRGYHGDISHSFCYTDNQRQTGDFKNAMDFHSPNTILNASSKFRLILKK